MRGACFPLRGGEVRAGCCCSFLSTACPSPAGRCLQPASIYAAHLHVCIPPGKRNVMQATQGEEWGGQTPGGDRVGLDFLVLLHQGKRTRKKGCYRWRKCSALRVNWIYSLCQIVSGRELTNVNPTPASIIYAWCILAPPGRGGVTCCY
jgi:hypothetical protein